MFGVGATAVGFAGSLVNFITGKTKTERQAARQEKGEERQAAKKAKELRKIGEKLTGEPTLATGVFAQVWSWIQKNYKVILMVLGGLVAIFLVWKYIIKKPTRRRGNPASLAKARRARAAKRRRR